MQLSFTNLSSVRIDLTGMHETINPFIKCHVNEINLSISFVLLCFAGFVNFLKASQSFTLNGHAGLFIAGAFFNENTRRAKKKQ